MIRYKCKHCAKIYDHGLGLKVSDLISKGAHVTEEEHMKIKTLAYVRSGLNIGKEYWTYKNACKMEVK